jgi:hypothetical protein
MTIEYDVTKTTNVNMQRRKENNKKRDKKKGRKKRTLTLLPDCAAVPLHSHFSSFSPFLNNLPFLSSSFEKHAYFHLPFQSPVRHEREDLISIAYLRNILKGKKKISPTALALYSRSSTPRHRELLLSPQRPNRLRGSLREHHLLAFP